MVPLYMGDLRLRNRHLKRPHFTWVCWADVSMHHASVAISEYEIISDNAKVQRPPNKHAWL